MRYSRQTMLAEIGAEGQRRLAEASVLVVGVGGLGSAAALYLAGAGVGHISLRDADTVGLSNLQRQVLYSTALIGRPKAEMAAQRLRELNPDIEVTFSAEALTAENAAEALKGTDLVVDCTDNFPTRFIIDDACAAAGVPWVYGSIGEFAGQVAIFNGQSGTRYGDLFPDREALCARPQMVAGVLGTLPGVIGAMQASEALKFLAGFGEPLDGRLFTIDLKTLQTNIINL